MHIPLDGFKPVASCHEYWVWPTKFMQGRAYSTIFYAFGCHNGSLFILSPYPMLKILLLSLEQLFPHENRFNIPSFVFTWNTISTIPLVLWQFEIACWVTPNVSASSFWRCPSAVFPSNENKKALHPANCILLARRLTWSVHKKSMSFTLQRSEIDF